MKSKKKNYNYNSTSKFNHGKKFNNKLSNKKFNNNYRPQHHQQNYQKPAYIGNRNFSYRRPVPSTHNSYNLPLYPVQQNPNLCHTQYIDHSQPSLIYPNYFNNHPLNYPQPNRNPNTNFYPRKKNFFRQKRQFSKKFYDGPRDEYKNFKKEF
jgi:hypothetical protein